MKLSTPNRACFNTDIRDKQGKANRNKYIKQISGAKDIAHSVSETLTIRDINTLKSYLSKLLECGEYVLDLETTGLDATTDKIVGICLYAPNTQPAYVPINHTDLDLNILPGQLTEEEVKNELSIFFSKSPKAINHNMKFDECFLQFAWGLSYGNLYWDTMIASHMMNENEPKHIGHKLKPLWAKYVGKTKDTQSFKELFDKIPFNFVPIDLASIYGGNDGIKTYELYKFQTKYLNEKAPKGLSEVYKLFREVEMPLVSVLVDMHLTGVQIDLDVANKLKLQYAKIVGEKALILQDFVNSKQTLMRKHPDLIRLVGDKMRDSSQIWKLNFNSPLQKSAFFYDIMQFPIVDRKKPRSVDKSVLEGWDNMPLTESQDKFLEAYSIWNKHHKLLKDFIIKLPDMVSPTTNLLHCEFNQIGTVTGRFSSSNPNLQQIPSKNGHKVIRTMFKAKQGKVLVGSDYSQAEPRILTVFGEVSRMKYAYENNMDLYALMASEIFGKKYEDCLEKDPKTGETQAEGKELRGQVKSVLLGLMYGRQPASIAKQFGKSAKWGEELFKQFFKTYPEVEQAITKSTYVARKYGFVTTLMGRKRRLPNMKLDKSDYRYITTERQCLNSVIQGSSADIMKLCMVRLFHNPKFKAMGGKILITVHDELITEVDKLYAKDMSELLATVMKETAYDLLKLPQKCDVEVSENWCGEDISDKL